MNFAQRIPGPFCVLDSSFNPPTIAHRALLLALPPSPHKLSRLLLLGTSNADKAAVPASFHHRTQMMLLLAKTIPESGVALIDRPTFAEKARQDAELKGATWIMGWDTLIRFFAEKYYPGGTMGNVMRTFFLEDGAKVFYALRGLDQNRDSVLAQLKWIEGFLKEQGIPPERVAKVDIGDELHDISSSAVRKAIKDGKEWKWMVTDEVAEYIETEGLYSD